MKNILIILTILILSTKFLPALNPEWVVFTQDSIHGAIENNVDHILIDSNNNKWVSGFSYVFVYNNKSWSKNLTFKYVDNTILNAGGFYDIVFNYRNSNWLFGGTILRLRTGKDTIVINPDSFPSRKCHTAQAYGGYLWIGTIDSGLIRYDGTNYVTYNKSNGLFPTNDINYIKIDSSGIFWMCTELGLLKWDGKNFTTWDLNSANGIYLRFYSLSLDKAGNKWLTYQDDKKFCFKIAKFDGIKVTEYDSTTSSVLANNGHDFQAFGIDFDSHGNKWIATEYGLIKFDDVSFTRFNLPTGLDQICNTVAVDKDDNVWLGTLNSGIAVYNPDGVHFTGVPKDESNPLNTVKSKYFPNPAERKININYQVDRPENITCEIYNETGGFISRVFDKYIAAGEYDETINTENLPNGTYFFKLKIGNRVETKQVIIAK